MQNRKLLLSASICLTSAACFAIPVTPGDLVIYRVGDGTGSLVNTGSAVFVDEYTPTGTLVESIPLPSGSSLPTGQNDLVASGTANSEGLLTVSPNGQYITLTGYDAAVGSQTKSISGSTSTAVPRTVGIISTSTGNVDTSTALTDFVSANNPRTAFTTDGTNIWVGGAGDVSFTTIGSSTSTALSTAVTNVDQINDFAGQLYFSSQKTTGALGSVGTNLPTTAGQSTTMLPGIPTNKNVYGFVMFDENPNVPGLDTLYLADQSANTIDKFILSSGTWTAAGSVAAMGATGLTGFVDPATGNVDLFATTGGSGATGGGTLYSFIDTTGATGTVSGTASSIATAGTDEAFRGIAYVPVVPEPATIALPLLGGLLLMKNRCRR
jgi:hypothetical protein